MSGTRTPLHDLRSILLERLARRRLELATNAPERQRDEPENSARREQEDGISD